MKKQIIIASLILLTICTSVFGKVIIIDDTIKSNPCEGIPFPRNIQCILANSNAFVVWSTKNVCDFSQSNPYTFQIKISEEYTMQDLTITVQEINKPVVYVCTSVANSGCGGVASCDRWCRSNGYGIFFSDSPPATCANQCKGTVQKEFSSLTVKADNEIIFSYPQDNTPKTIQLKDIVNANADCRQAVRNFIACHDGSGECRGGLFECSIPITASASMNSGAVTIQLGSYSSSQITQTTTTTTQTIQGTVTTIKNTPTDDIRTDNIAKKDLYYYQCNSEGKILSCFKWLLCLVGVC